MKETASEQVTPSYLELGSKAGSPGSVLGIDLVCEGEESISEKVAFMWGLER